MTTTASPVQDNPTRAIVLMVVSMAGFAMADMFVKLATERLPSGTIVLAMGLGGAVVFALLSIRRGIPLVTRDLLHPPILVRMGAEMVGMISVIFALRWTTLSTASAVMQATPLAVTLGAAVVLHETVGWRRWAAVSVGFVGVLVMLRPDGSGLNAGALMALVAVVGLSVRDLWTRLVPAHVPNLAISTYGFGALVPAGLVMMALEGPHAWPDGETWLLLGAMICAATASYFALTAALRLGDMATVASFRYSRLIFAFALGMVVFGEVLTPQVLLGSALVATSGLYTLAREKRLHRARLRAIQGERPPSPAP